MIKGIKTITHLLFKHLLTKLGMGFNALLIPVPAVDLMIAYRIINRHVQFTGDFFIQGIK